MAYTTIDDPSVYFHTQLYNGNGSSQSITNDANAGDFKPDWLWTKSRNDAFDHITRDSSRGVSKRLITHSTAAEDSASGTTSFDTDGFTLDSTNTVNKSTDNYVAWQWKVNGGTTANNTSGDIGTSVVQANTTAGISIVLFTGNNTGGSTVGHGLGGVPEWIIAKSRAADKPWVVYHVGMGNTKSIKLNSTDAAATDSSAWTNTTPSSTTFSLGNGDSNHTGTMVAYCFRSIQGYSKFGSYTGNGNADGPFVYTGFAPAWIMFKRTDGGTQNWFILDNKRDDGMNPRNSYIMPNQSNAEDANNSTVDTDFLSNGFKLRATTGAMNGNNETFIYMAFAEHPFVSSEGVPVTAR
jgi:hypothetical protein